VFGGLRLASARSLPIRTRLTIWYVLVLGAALLVFAGATSAVLHWQLSRQLTRFAIQDIETIEGLLFFDRHGTLQLNEDYHNHTESRKVLERLLEVLSPDGKLLYRNWRLGTDSLGAAPFPGEGVGGYSPRTIRTKEGSLVLVVSRRHVMGGRPLVIRVGYRKDTVSAQIWQFLSASFTAMPLALLLVAIFGFQLARRSLAPMVDMARLAEQITAENLHERLPLANPRDEIGQLGAVINKLLDRLDRAFAQLRRFTSDASHELRTPLAAIRSVGEVSLQESRSTEEYRDTIGSMLEEVNRLTSLVENLLTVSRADAGQIQLRTSVFSPHELVQEVVSLIEVLAEERGQQIVVSGDASAAVRGDRLLLRQALVNILHNATKYSPAGGTITVSTGISRPGWVSIAISDSGPGIAPEHRDKIFRRFYRIDEGRTREAGGSGLGLAIAQWSVQAHGGEIAVEDSAEGAIFAITLPAYKVST
jgi:heavy metal sensor kinase